MATNTDIITANNELIKDKDEGAHASIVFLNCGGCVNVRDIITLGDSVTCYVLDCHRPVNLKNIYGE